jgi:streptomycin 6-kinase
MNETLSGLSPMARQKALQLGRPGQLWLDGLPDLVALRTAWEVPLPCAVAPPAPEKAVELGRMVDRLWEGREHLCSSRVVAEAMRCAERRAAAFDLDRCVVVHGDPHPGNALRVVEPREGAGSGYVFVDPDGFLADPTYDLGVVLRDWCDELLAADDAMAVSRGYCRLLADRSDVDDAAI